MPFRRKPKSGPRQPEKQEFKFGPDSQKAPIGSKPAITSKRRKSKAARKADNKLF